MRAVIRLLGGTHMKPSPIAWTGIGLLVVTTHLACGSEGGPIFGPPNGIGSMDGGPGPQPGDAGTPVDPVEAMLDLIDTEPDPDYVYPFDQARFVPPEDKTLLILGQTLDAVDELLANFPDQPIPGGWAAYWGIPSMDYVDREATNETGDRHHHQALVERFPNTVLQSGMWMVGTFNVAQRTVDGEFDPVIRAFSAWAKAAARPIYLRIGYEFDGPHNELEPTQYITAYRRIVDIMRAEGVENVAFVWHSFAAPPAGGRPISAWYPGDDYVDWVAVSLFGQIYAASPGRYVDAVFDFAREKRKPVMVAEASPINGINASNAVWSSWFAKLFSLSYQRNIKAITFISQNWEQNPSNGVDWEDARLQNNELVSRAFFAETNKDRYLKQSPTLFQELGYTP
ncbi:MAG: glycosyl hydrolase [Myxococcota bacterium]